MKDWNKQQEQKYLIDAGAEGHIVKSPESSIKNNVKDMYLIHYQTYDHDPAIRRKIIALIEVLSYQYEKV